MAPNEIRRPSHAETDSRQLAAHEHNDADSLLTGALTSTAQVSSDTSDAETTHAAIEVAAAIPAPLSLAIPGASTRSGCGFCVR